MLNQTLCTSFKAEVLLGVHDFRATGGDVFKIALYTSTANLGADTTQYTSDGEVVGINYTAGGIPLTNLGVTTSTSGARGFTNFADAVFPLVTLVARGALIYNATPSATAEDGSTLTNPAVCVLDFGADKTANGNNFTVYFPPSTANNAIVRIT